MGLVTFCANPYDLATSLSTVALRRLRSCIRRLILKLGIIKMMMRQKIVSALIEADPLSFEVCFEIFMIMCFESTLKYKVNE